MAHKKGEGSTQNGRDSNSQRLGVKLFGGQLALAGNIIVRQRGTKFHPGENVYLGKDYTLHAGTDGTVAFRKGRHNRTFVSIIPFDEVVETVAPMPKEKTPKPVEIKDEAVTVSRESVARAVETPAPVTEEKPVVKEETPVAEEKPVAAEEAPALKAAPAPAPKAKKDDLKKIEGIGPKIASLLNDAGIFTFKELAAAEVDKLREILDAAGSRYRIHDPGTWSKQAELAAEDKWDELKEWQDSLKGGKEE